MLQKLLKCPTISVQIQGFSVFLQNFQYKFPDYTWLQAESETCLRRFRARCISIERAMMPNETKYK